MNRSTKSLAGHDSFEGNGWKKRVRSAFSLTANLSIFHLQTKIETGYGPGEEQLKVTSIASLLGWDSNFDTLFDP